MIRLRSTGDRRVYLTLGHRSDVHRTAGTGQCTCHAELHGKSCFHAATVALYATQVQGRTVRAAGPMPPVTYTASAWPARKA